eukprot:4553989-Pleurochrysis_carterae.AAC.1
MRRGGERQRRRTRSPTDGAERPQDTDDLLRFPAPLRELSIHTSQMQIFPVQPSQTGDTHHTKGSCAGGGEERTHAGVATGRRRIRGRRGGTQWGRRRQGQRRKGREVIGVAGMWGTQRWVIPCDADPTTHDIDGWIERQEVKREEGTFGTCAIPLERNHADFDCGIESAIRAPDMQCVIRSVNGKKQCATREGKCMERMDGTKQQTMLRIVVYVWVVIIIWLTRVGKECAEAKQEEFKKNRGGEKASSCAASKIQQRRIIQRRIKRWNKT